MRRLRNCHSETLNLAQTCVLGQALGKGWPRFANSRLGWRELSQPGYLQGLRLFQQMLVWVVCGLDDLLSLGREQAKPGAVSSFHFEVLGKVTEA